MNWPTHAKINIFNISLVKILYRDNRLGLDWIFNLIVGYSMRGALVLLLTLLCADSDS